MGLVFNKSISSAKQTIPGNILCIPVWRDIKIIRSGLIEKSGTSPPPLCLGSCASKFHLYLLLSIRRISQEKGSQLMQAQKKGSGSDSCQYISQLIFNIYSFGGKFSELFKRLCTCLSEFYQMKSLIFISYLT